MTEDPARALADGGLISPAGRWFAAGAAACAAHLPPGARDAAIRGAIARLATEDPATALHALAQALRGERDAMIRAARPDRAEVTRREDTWRDHPREVRSKQQDARRRRRPERRPAT